MGSAGMGRRARAETPGRKIQSPRHHAKRILSECQLLTILVMLILILIFPNKTLITRPTPTPSLILIKTLTKILRVVPMLLLPAKTQESRNLGRLKEPFLIADRTYILILTLLICPAMILILILILINILTLIPVIILIRILILLLVLLLLLFLLAVRRILQLLVPLLILIRIRSRLKFLVVLRIGILAPMARWSEKAHTLGTSGNKYNPGSGPLPNPHPTPLRAPTATPTPGGEEAQSETTRTLCTPGRAIPSQM